MPSLEIQKYIPVPPLFVLDHTELFHFYNIIKITWGNINPEEIVVEKKRKTC